jgi:hypothetical protein
MSGQHRGVTSLTRHATSAIAAATNSSFLPGGTAKSAISSTTAAIVAPRGRRRAIE